ncbi:DEKNAAC102715 [Brettanomyces naardenensis]|uniref:Sensitive to high expression protein 9, mitochondrial n=1 Tax=Brettanomyces naardenensis TaxID=13370 RepID=A0A448YKP5_BRENA|nr:DEKNAAC102715 [Brettanomyces naardenensis]
MGKRRKLSSQKPEEDVESLTKQTSKLIREIESEKSKLDKSTSPESLKSNSSNAGMVDFLNSVIDGENFQNLKKELTKFNESRLKMQSNYSESFSKRLGENVKELRSSIGIASKVVNDLTGYTRVNELKELIARNDSNLHELRDRIAEAKKAYNDAVEGRAQSQRDLNELLERKNSWTPEDLEKFTKMYMNEHALEGEVHQRSKALDQLEQKEDETHDSLIKSIMNRYHEEQVWSDKIRQFSTWGTVLIMVCNLILVLLVQLVFEPFKRSRLVHSFENKVRDLFAKNEEMGEEIKSLREDIQRSQQSISLQVSESNQKLSRLLPDETVEVTDTSFTSLLRLLISNLSSPFNSLSPETFVITKHDFQYFVFFFSSILLAAGCILGRTL